MLRKNKMMKMNKFYKNQNCNNYSNVKNVLNDKNSVMISEGMTGKKVEEIQKMLVEIVNLYPSLPIITIDGIYGQNTVIAVKEFQKLNSLPQTGIIDEITMRKLSYLHEKNREKFREELLKNKISEVKKNKKREDDYLDQSDNILSEGSIGEYVKSLQSYLNVVSNKYPTISLLRVDGIFGPKTKAAVMEFQRIFELKQDGVVGYETWNKLSSATGGNPISVDIDWGLLKWYNLPERMVNMSLNIVLVEPEIPENAGNIARTCAAIGAKLHLVKPYGFDISQSAVKKHMKRAGLDYWDKVQIIEYENLDDFKQKVGSNDIFLLSTKSQKSYTNVKYTENSYLIFGAETRGLPENYILENFDKAVRIPMLPGLRSLNLSNSVAIVAYEASRQLNFTNLQTVSDYFKS